MLLPLACFFSQENKPRICFVKGFFCNFYKLICGQTFSLTRCFCNSFGRDGMYMYICVYVCVYIYIYIYICAVKLLAGPSLGVFKAINWSKSKLLTGPRSFSHYKNRGFRRFCFAQLSLCVCKPCFVPNYLAIF